MVGFLWEKLEQDREFRSEDLQEENNEMESREKKQYNQMIIRSQQMQVQQSQATQALQQ